jgi:hypothetical protein
MEWSVMECIPSNTTHLCNFPFPPIWGVCDGMVHNNYNFTILPSILYFIKRLFSFLNSFSRFFFFFFVGVSSSSTTLFSLCFLLFQQGKALACVSYVCINFFVLCMYQFVWCGSPLFTPLSLRVRLGG